MGLLFKNAASFEVAQSKTVGTHVVETTSGRTKHDSVKDNSCGADNNASNAKFLETAIFKCVQAALSQQSEDDMQTEFASSGDENDFPTNAKDLDHPECFSPGRSTSVSSVDSSPDHSPASSDSGLSPKPGRVQVKNTFIHFNGELGDNRTVQSMPHGMFKKCLLEEARVETVFVTARGPLAHVEEVTPATAGTTIPHDDEMLSSGTEVVIEGLTRAPAFNGRRGVIQSLDEEIGRYTILLSSPGSSGGRQWAKVKRENLRLAATPPPAFAPSLVLEDCSAPNGYPYDMPETPMWCERHMACDLIAR